MIFKKLEIYIMIRILMITNLKLLVKLIIHIKEIY